MDAKVRPMLCEQADQRPDGSLIVPEGPEWVAEGKLDGWRIVCLKTGEGQVRAYSRSGEDYALRIPTVVEAVLAALPNDSAIDGELIGAEFGTVQSQVTRIGGSDLSLSYVLFDVLRIGGNDTRAMPWSDRRLLLERMRLESPLMLSPTGPSSQEKLDQMLSLGLEGIVCKRRDARYVNGRSRLWLKCKPQSTTEAEIIGFEAGKKGGRWANGVGAFTVRLLETGAETTVKCGTDANHRDAHTNPHHWLGQIIEIRHHGFQAKTGKVRHPVFLRRRDDLTPAPEHAPRAASRRPKAASSNGATGKMRNYGAMKDAKLLACFQDLERGDGDAYERALVGSGQPAADLARCRELVAERGLA
jgi:ATP-dependent DNA ligase